MTREYGVTVEGQFHAVVVSDDKEALLAAQAAGKASVELGASFLARYAVESLDDLSREYLEQVARRGYPVNRRTGRMTKCSGTRSF